MLYKQRPQKCGLYYYKMIKTEDLHLNGLQILQDDNGFKFGTDAVLLAWFCKTKKFSNAIDLCSGNGIIPILLSTQKYESVTGIEINEKQCELFNDSIILNKLKNIYCINSDIRLEPLKATKAIKSGQTDLVSVNPPYFETFRGLSAADEKTAARSESLCSLDNVAETASYLLKHGGRFCMIHRTERLCDIFEAMRKYKIEPKRFIPIVSVKGKNPELCLIEGKKGGGMGLKFDSPIIISDKSGKYTEQANTIYGFDRNFYAEERNHGKR